MNYHSIFYLMSLVAYVASYNVPFKLIRRNNLSSLNSKDCCDNHEDSMEFEFIDSSESASTMPPNNEEKPKKNKQVAFGSTFLGVALFVLSQSQPAVSGVALLKTMENTSPRLEEAVCNGKSTIIDFYAPWCESCKEIAPSVRYIEKLHADSLNVVTLDATNPKYGYLVDKFKVDGIPHLAFLDANAKAVTSLIGAVPKNILIEDVDALIKGKPDLPVIGYDAFKNEPSHSPFENYQSKFCPVPSQEGSS